MQPISKASDYRLQHTLLKLTKIFHNPVENTQLIKPKPRLANPPRLVRVLNIDGYRITSLWTNGETRINDFTQLISTDWKDATNLNQLSDKKKFSSVVVNHGVYHWPAIKTDMRDCPGVEPWQPLDLDPDFTYAQSNLVSTFDIKPKLAGWIKNLREENGLTQAELAGKVGVKKSYISKIERGVTDVQVGTLAWILEAGFNKKLDSVWALAA